MSPSINKYWGIVWQMIDKADVVVEVVDARFPSICRSNRLEKRVQELEHCNLLIALNKSDLIPRSLLNKWITWFRDQEGIDAIGVSAKERLGTSRIRREILKKSAKKRVTVAIVGLPNTGKSSLINTLKGRKSARTAPVAGFTKGMQKIKVSNSLMMYDTPGIIPAKLPEKHKYLLGVIAVTKLEDPIGVALSLYQQFEELMPGKVAEYYEMSSTPATFLEDLAVKHNRVMAGDTPDIRTAAVMFLNDHVRARIPVYENIEDNLRY